MNATSGTEPHEDWSLKHQLDLPCGWWRAENLGCLPLLSQELDRNRSSWLPCRPHVYVFPVSSFLSFDFSRVWVHYEKILSFQYLYYLLFIEFHESVVYCLWLHFGNSKWFSLEIYFLFLSHFLMFCSHCPTDLVYSILYFLLFSSHF